jgi:general secretion pathway protein C
MSSRWTGFIIWALVAASAAFWGLRIFAATRPLPLEARVPSRPVASNSPLTRLFGALPEPEAASAPPPESDRFALQGVIAEGAQGVAIVSIDGQPPRPWRVGSALEGDTTLISVTRRTAAFGPRGGPASFTLELPEPTAAATGSLPATGLSNASPGGTPMSPMANGNGMVNGGRPMGQVNNPGMRAPGAYRGPNGLPVMPPRAMPVNPQVQPGQAPANPPDEE